MFCLHTFWYSKSPKKVYQEKEKKKEKEKGGQETEIVSSVKDQPSPINKSTHVQHPRILHTSAPTTFSEYEVKEMNNIYNKSGKANHAEKRKLGKLSYLTPVQ